MNDSPTTGSPPLLTAEQRFRFLAEAVTDYAFILFGTDNCIVGWNTGAEHLLGYSEAEILGRSGAVFFTPEDRAQGAVEEELETARIEGRAADERWHLKKGGVRFWGSGVMTALRDDTGQLLGFAKIMRDETQRKRAEDALAASVERFRLAARATNDAVMDWDLRSDRIIWNEGVQTLFGYAPDVHEGPASWWRDRMHPEDRASVVKQLDYAIKTGIELWSQEYRFRCADGSYAYVLDRAFILRNPAGEPIRVIGSLQDLTGRKRAEAALQESEERLRLFVDNVRDYALFQVDLEGRITSWNNAATRLFHYPAEEILGKSITILQTPENAASQSLTLELRETCATGRSEREELLQRRDGTTFWARWTTAAIYDQQGVLRGYAKVLRDETEQRSLIQSLQDSEQRLQLAQTIAGVGTWDWTIAEDRCVWSNSMGLLFGLLAGTSLGTVGAFLERVHPEDRAATQAALQRCLAQGNSYEVRFRVRWPDSSVHWLLAIGHVFRDAQGRAERMLGVAMDITERQQREEATAQEKRQLTERVQRTGEALDRSKAELRALAASLITAQEEERRRIARELHDDLAQRLALIEMELTHLRQQGTPWEVPLSTAISHLATLSEEVRRLSHGLHPSVLETLGLEAALRSLCEEWEHTGNLPVRCVFSPLSRPVPLVVATALYRIAQEALRNVQKHAGDARVTVTLSDTGQDLHLTITDDGVGYEPAAQHAGGLGVISMQERATLLGGCVGIHSVPGHGTAIKITIPWPEQA